MNTSGWTKKESPFHAGEKAIQDRLGVREQMENFGRRVIRDYLPEQHRAFYRNLPFLVLASVDDEGRPWASLVAGDRGFITSPDPHSLRVGRGPIPGSPLGDHGSTGMALGILGMLPDARRRNRATGRLSHLGADHFTIAIDQAFGNCPQYIQARDVTHDLAYASAAKSVRIHEGTDLDAAATSLIAEADTFFIASAYGDGKEGPHTGADASHRGGKAGFVRVEGNTLTFPDFSGNNHFNTLGNIALTGRAGLLFIDHDNGELLYLTGEAEVIWDDPAIDAFDGAQRFVAVTVTRWRRVAGSLPLHFEFLEESPSFAALGSWEAARERTADRERDSRYEPLEIVRVSEESQDIRSLYLKPVNGEPPATHRAGQYLPVRLAAGENGAPVDRFYSLSHWGDGKHYRLSIKRDGLASNFVHDALNTGDRILAKRPAGPFVLDENSDRPVVLLSAGVGITPVLAMVHALVSSAERGAHERDVYFIHGARNHRNHAFYAELQALADRYGRLHLHFVYSQPEDVSPGSERHNSTGRIDLALLKRLLPLDDYDFYICGPGALTSTLQRGLQTLRIPAERIHYEAFGPATADGGIDEIVPAEADPVPVRFEESQIEVLWSPAKGTLLDLAESEGIDAPFACRSGSCGSCAVPKRQGAIKYARDVTASDGENEVLLCSAIPVPANGDELVLAL